MPDCLSPRFLTVVAIGGFIIYLLHTAGDKNKYAVYSGFFKGTMLFIWRVNIYLSAFISYTASRFGESR